MSDDDKLWADDFGLFEAVVVRLIRDPAMAKLIRESMADRLLNFPDSAEIRGRLCEHPECAALVKELVAERLADQILSGVRPAGGNSPGDQGA